MDRLTTFFGRLAGRQEGESPIKVNVPPLIPTPSSTGHSSTTPSPSSTSSPVPTSTSAPQVESTVSPSSSSRAFTSISSEPASTATRGSEPSVILVQTIATPAAGNDPAPARTTLTTVNTQTAVVIENKTVTPTTSSTASDLPERAGASSSFLDNKVASGIVFGICGLVGLLLIFLIVWFAMRKRRRVKKLEREIISFDPEDVGHFHQRQDVETTSVNSYEKGRSASSLNHYAGSGYAPTMKAENADFRNYGAQRMALQRPGNVAFNSMANGPPQPFRR